MFFKYFLNNLKKHFLQYALIIALETALLCVALTASGIALNMLSGDYGADYWARKYEFWFSEPISYDNDRDTIYDFLNDLPNSYEEVMVTAPGIYGSPLFSYPDHNTMFRVLNKRFGVERKDLPTEEQFNNGEKTAIVGATAGEELIDGEYVQIKYDFTDDDHIMIDGEEYLVTGRYSGWGVYVLFNSAPKGCSLRGMDVRFKTVPTKTELETVYELTARYFGDVKVTSTPKIDDLLEERWNDANILLSVATLAMSVFNTLLVFRYMISSQKKYFAILRLVGFSKATGAIYSGVELLIVSMISALFSCFVFGKLIMPIMGKYYSVFSGAVFTVDYYITLYGVFLGISAVMFLVYIVPSLTRSVAAELREI